MCVSGLDNPPGPAPEQLDCNKHIFFVSTGSDSPTSLSNRDSAGAVQNLEIQYIFNELFLEFSAMEVIKYLS
jgi:hypothetical protein